MLVTDTIIVIVLRFMCQEFRSVKEIETKAAKLYTISYFVKLLAHTPKGKVMTQQPTNLQNWLKESHLGQYVIQQENDFFQAAFSHIHAQRILQIGLPECYPIIGNRHLWIQQNSALPADVVAENTTIWRSNTFDAIMLPHYLEQPNAKAVLTELTRIVQPYGYMVLTCFNPHSLWRYQRNLPMQYAISLPELKLWLPELGWKIEMNKFMNYLPYINSPNIIKHFQFMEEAGNRWFPNYAAIYGLVLRKYVTPLRSITNETNDVLLTADIALSLTRSRN